MLLAADLLVVKLAVAVQHLGDRELVVTAAASVLMSLESVVIAAALVLVLLE